MRAIIASRVRAFTHTQRRLFENGGLGRSVDNLETSAERKGRKLCQNQDDLTKTCKSLEATMLNNTRYIENIRRVTFDLHDSNKMLEERINSLSKNLQTLQDATAKKFHIEQVEGRIGRAEGRINEVDSKASDVDYNVDIIQTIVYFLALCTIYKYFTDKN